MRTSVLLLAALITLLSACASPVWLKPTEHESTVVSQFSTEDATETRESPKQNTLTPTSEPTFTKSPPTPTPKKLFSPTPAETPVKISGSGNSTIKVVGNIPTDLDVTADSAVTLFAVFKDGTQADLGNTLSVYPGNPVVFLKVVTIGSWTIAYRSTSQTASALIPDSKPTTRAISVPTSRSSLGPTATRKPPASFTPSPAYPVGATAICMDNTYSYSQHRSGTCSRHGGVMRWLVNLPN